MRVLIVSHAHPEFSPGGTENAAYGLFKSLRDTRGVSAMFVARAPAAAGQAPFVRRHAADGSEVLLRATAKRFRFSQQRVETIEAFRHVLDSFRPTVIHFHHYVELGIELIREARNYSATLPIVLTTHEFEAICHNYGQMVKTGSQELCVAASRSACARCFPEIPADDFYLRERFLRSHLSLVDSFVSPSRFLVERYVAWGLPRERFEVIENGLPADAIRDGPHDGTIRAPRTKFGFFGQIAEHKGLHVLLDAMLRLRDEPDVTSSSVTLSVNGSGLGDRAVEYQTRILTRAERLGSAVRMNGAYTRGDVPKLMHDVDWVVVPSIWWENSPLVIQEAFANGRPVICSGIGGMAEKVSDGVNGIHFQVGDVADLARRMADAATSPGLHERLVAGIPPVLTTDEVGRKHAALYARLLDRRNDQM
jgi:glycosyltransferase involved in cell wall biosynthesis